MEKFSFYFLLQVLDEIGVDVASLVGIRSYSFLDLVTIWLLSKIQGLKCLGVGFVFVMIKKM